MIASVLGRSAHSDLHFNPSCASFYHTTILSPYCMPIMCLLNIILFESPQERVAGWGSDEDLGFCPRGNRRLRQK